MSRFRLTGTGANDMEAGPMAVCGETTKKAGAVDEIVFRHKAVFRPVREYVFMVSPIALGLFDYKPYAVRVAIFICSCWWQPVFSKD